MIVRYSCIFIALFVLFSCQDEKQREAEKVRDQNKKELVFASISKSWSFNARPINQASQEMVSDWPAWRDLLRELDQKPRSSIGAFQKKARVLTTRAAELSKKIPLKYDLPEMRSRISVLVTKINSLNLFVNLDEIPAAKIAPIISEINDELVALQLQMDEIERRKRIPVEEGESEMIRMLDTSRAVPTKPQKTQPIEQGQIIR